MSANGPYVPCENCEGSGRQARIGADENDLWMPRAATADMIVSAVRDCPTCDGSGRVNA